MGGEGQWPVTLRLYALVRILDDWAILFLKKELPCDLEGVSFRADGRTNTQHGLRRIQA